MEKAAGHSDQRCAGARGAGSAGRRGPAAHAPLPHGELPPGIGPTGAQRRGPRWQRGGDGERRSSLFTGTSLPAGKRASVCSRGSGREGLRGVRPLLPSPAPPGNRSIWNSAGASAPWSAARYLGRERERARDFPRDIFIFNFKLLLDCLFLFKRELVAWSDHLAQAKPSICSCPPGRFAPA